MGPSRLVAAAVSKFWAETEKQENSVARLVTYAIEPYKVGSEHHAKVRPISTLPLLNLSLGR